MNYFTADLHIYHERAVSFPDRKEFTVESWADMCYNLINSIPEPSKARLYVLGDIGFHKRSFLVKIRNKIKLKDLWLIHGNHDPPDSVCKEIFGSKFRNTHECKVNGTKCWLSHYPHLAWPASHYGSYHLYGHLHNQRTNFWENIFPDIRALDVSPEGYKSRFGEWGIFNENQIDQILGARKGHDSLEWYKEQRGEYGRS